MGQIFTKALIGIAVTGAGALLLYPFRKARKMGSTSNYHDSAQNELVQQCTNCLTTLQTQGTQQVELLTEVVKTLGEIHLDNSEMLTHLRDKM